VAINRRRQIKLVVSYWTWHFWNCLRPEFWNSSWFLEYQKIFRPSRCYETTQSKKQKFYFFFVFCFYSLANGQRVKSFLQTLVKALKNWKKIMTYYSWLFSFFDVSGSLGISQCFSNSTFFWKNVQSCFSSGVPSDSWTSKKSKKSKNSKISNFFLKFFDCFAPLRDAKHHGPSGRWLLSTPSGVFNIMIECQQNFLFLLVS
jgi:hypothetical protein